MRKQKPVTGLSKRDRNVIKQALGQLIAEEEIRDAGFGYANKSWRRSYLLNLANKVAQS